jgi:drug/metabolite transporter (DMT)-like permease
MSAQQSDSTGRTPRRTRAGLFDVRMIIGTLLGIYGVVLTVYGLAFTSEADLAKANGTNLNLWTGVTLIIASAIFIVWARVRPVLVPVEPEDDAAAREEGSQPPPL